VAALRGGDQRGDVALRGGGQRGGSALVGQRPLVGGAVALWAMTLDGWRPGGGGAVALEGDGQRVATTLGLAKVKKISI
jgi:hypothetical protein